MSENVTIRHMTPVANIRSIANLLETIVENGRQDRNDNILIGPSVQRLIRGYCEQLRLDADHLEKGDNREGAIPEEH